MQFYPNKIIYQNLSAYPRVICIQVPNLTVSMVSLWFQAGSRYSPPRREGLAHLFEHLFISRTRQYPKKQDFLAETERQGLVYGAFTGKELVSYRLICAPGGEQLALSHLIKAYETATFSQTALKQEKLVVQNEEERNRANPSFYIGRLADRNLWPKSELSKDVFGSDKSLERITLKDLKSFRRRFYQPNNMTVVVITPRWLKPKIIRDEMDHYVSQEGRVFPRMKPLRPWKGGVSLGGSASFLPHSSPQSGEVLRREIKFSPVKKQFLEHREIEDTIVNVSYRLKALSFKKRVIMDFIAYYLASGWVSVLVQELRLKLGLTYWVEAERLSLADAGFLRFKFTTKPDQVKRTIKVIRTEAGKLRLKKLSAKTLTLHKKAILARILLGISNPYRMLNYYGQFARKTEEKVYLFNKVVKIIRGLTGEEILKVANEHLDNEQISVAMIGKGGEA